MKYFNNLENYILSNIEKFDHKIGEFALLNNDREIQHFIGVVESTYNLQCMLAIYYPPGGGLGWHTNEEANMHNAIVTYSTSNESFIELKDKKVYDKANIWTVKYTYWTEDNPIPHRVVSLDHRISFAFSSSEEHRVRTFINSIS